MPVPGRWVSERGRHVGSGPPRRLADTDQGNFSGVRSHTEPMTVRSQLADIRSQVAAMPIVPRFTVVGSVAAFLLGALIGLVVGLIAYPPTAWFAIFELGVPAGILGAAVGAAAGVVTGRIHRIKVP